MHREGGRGLDLNKFPRSNSFEVNVLITFV
jgi:hypothetical protein